MQCALTQVNRRLETTSVDFYQGTRSEILDYRIFQSYCRDNLQFNTEVYIKIFD
jgi:hypothetical protein